MGERVHKSILNAEVNLLFYFLTLVFAFFSRKIFLDCLGAEFIGLTGTLGSILGYLNLTEFGLAGCISYFLFKPIQTNDREKIKEIMSLFGYLYCVIGGIILIGGIVVSLFFPFIFKDAGVGLGIVYFAFYSILGSAMIGYFINYRALLLTADQKNYLVSIYTKSADIVKIVLQIYLAYNYKNVYVWVGIEFLFAVIGCIILNWKINKEYPWLKVNKRNGRHLLKKYPDVLVKTKQVFIHKIKDFMLVKSDELFIFAFVSLKMVAFYGNYMIIFSRLISLFSSVTGGVSSSVGNLVAEGNKPNMLKVFWEYTTIQHTIAAILSFSLYSFTEPFIAHWLGPEYSSDHKILILLIVFIYITNSRNAVDNFNHAHGLYADVWSAWTELALNIGITVVCGLQWGIVGILLGKIVSLLTIVVLWKPYYLFTAGFKEPVGDYWRGVIRNYAISFGSFALAVLALSLLPIDPYDGISAWIAYSATGMLIFLSLDLPATYFFAKGSKDVVNRIKNIRK